MLSTGELYSWGGGLSGALATGVEQSTRVPVPAPGFGPDIVEIAAGVLHSCARPPSGEVLCVGSGVSGQLGDGQRQRSLSAVQVVGLPGAATQLAMGYAGSAALVDGGVFCWGSAGTVDDAGITVMTDTAVPYIEELSSGVTHLASGWYHRCAVKAGEVWCWGANDDGELGFDRPFVHYVPMKVPGIDAGVTALGLAENHSCALADGEVWCWGRNALRQVWWGSTQTWIDQPFKVVGAGKDVVALAVGRSSTCVLKGPAGARSVMCWGSGALGDGTSTTQRTQPVMVLDVTGNVEALVGGETHYCALVDREIRCWGVGEGVGHGLTSPALVPVPITAP